MKKQNNNGLFPSTRLAVALVGFLGCVIVYSLRSDLNFAIVCMVNDTALNDETSEKKSECSAEQLSNETTEDKIEGDLIWTKKEQGYAISSFYWGYICSQVIGGQLAARFGARIVVGVSVFLSAIATLLCPTAAYLNVYVFLCLRAVIGLAQGVIYPALHTLWSKWAPPLERGLLVSLCYAGNQIGVTITMPISAVLCKYGFDGGWPSVYYIFGALGILWSVLWFFYLSDTPETHKFINNKEKYYIQSKLGTHQRNNTRKVPWIAMLKSKAVWGLWCGHFAADWGAYMMMSSLPTFLNDVMDLDLNSMGGVAAAPYIAYFVFINVAGYLSDVIRSSNLLSTTVTRKAAMIIAMGGQAGFLIGTAYCGCSEKSLIIIFITLGVGMSGFAYAGFVVNYLDIAGEFAGPLVGIGNTLTCIGGIVGPIIVGWITESGTRAEWRLVFWITAIILLVGTALFTVFANGELESWAKDDECAQFADASSTETDSEGKNHCSSVFIDKIDDKKY